MNTQKSKTVADLWPGDVVVATRPGGYTGMPSRVVSLEEREVCGGQRRVFIDLAREGFEFTVMVAGWDTPVEGDCR